MSTRIQGVLFHETAERAGKRGYTKPEEWKAAARSIAHTRGEQAAIPAVEACIDRFFKLEVSEWEILSAERDFELDLSGERVVGQIDAICRTPNDDLVVLDYKATDRTRDIETDLQLPLYVLACQELFEKDVDYAGYAYVGAAGPKLETRSFDASALADAVDRSHDRLDHASRSSYEPYTQGDHCEWCPHASLPCSPFGTF